MSEVIISNLRISLLITSFGKTGVEITMIRLAEGLARLSNTEVFLCVLNFGSGPSRELDSRVQIVDLRAPRLWTGLIGFIRHVKRKKLNVFIGAAPLCNALVGYTKLFIRQRNCAIATEHGLHAFGEMASKKSLKVRVLTRFINSGYKYVDAIVGVSNGVETALRARLPSNSPRILTIYNPVFYEELTSGRLYPSGHDWLDEKQGYRVILGAGRHDQAKGFDNLIRAFALISQKKLRLVLLGEGVETQSLMQLARTLGVSESVDFPGFVQNPVSYFAKSDLVVMSSLYEALPTVLIEAMACGTPVVSTDCPTGPREIMEGGKFGCLVPVNEPKALADAIVRTLKNPIDARSLIERAKDFSVEAAAKRYMQLADDILKN